MNNPMEETGGALVRASGQEVATVEQGGLTPERVKDAVGKLLAVLDKNPNALQQMSEGGKAVVVERARGLVGMLTSAGGMVGDVARKAEVMVREAADKPLATAVQGSAMAVKVGAAVSVGKMVMSQDRGARLAGNSIAAAYHLACLLKDVAVGGWNAAVKINNAVGEKLDQATDAIARKLNEGGEAAQAA